MAYEIEIRERLKFELLGFELTETFHLHVKLKPELSSFENPGWGPVEHLTPRFEALNWQKRWRTMKNCSLSLYELQITMKNLRLRNYIEYLDYLVGSVLVEKTGKNRLKNYQVECRLGSR